MLARIVKYVRTYGLAASAAHISRRAYRSLVPPMRHVYCAYLTDIPLPAGSEDSPVRVRAFQSIHEIPSAVLEELLSRGTIDDKKPYSDAVVTSFLTWLFSQGAVFWTCYEDKKLVGYLWSIQGSREEPRYHFFPLGTRDAVFLAHEIFPAYRGRQLNRTMTHLVLGEMKASGIERVYVDVELSNTRSLQSFSKTFFSPVGLARMKKLKKRQIVVWARKKQPAVAGSIPKS